MRHTARADHVFIDSTETGFEMTVLTDDSDTFIFNIQGVAWDLAQNADETIGAWRREGEDARVTYIRRPTQEDLEGYELGDPKRIALEREMNR